MSTRKREPVSRIRKAYFCRLVLRVLIFILTVVLYIRTPSAFDVLQENVFFEQFSPLHLVWVIWIADMIQQLIPVKDQLPLGSQKVFRQRFRPVRERINAEALKAYVVSTTRSAFKVVILWGALVAVLSILYRTGVLSAAHLFLISTAFYVCDLICVLIWCPFRLILKNRCCTTCRIFNWDHLMMFTPMLLVGSFFTSSLLLLAVAVWMVWEFCVLIHPERFWYKSNAALQCSACTDKLCTQYCQKLRRPEKSK